MSYQPITKLYGRYVLKDLTITKTGLPNMPTTLNEFQNLVWLAKVLDQIYTSLGKFEIISAFRTSAVQRAVTGSSYNPDKKSYHEIGLAADIYPVGQTIDSFYGRLIASEWKHKLGEIIIKPTQNSIHIGLPTKNLRSKLMILDKTYRLLTEAEIERYAGPYKDIVPTGFSSNETNYSIPDPSGGLFTDLYTGLFGVYPTHEDWFTVSIFDPSEGDEVKVSTEAKIGGIVTLSAAAIILGLLLK